MQEMRVYLLNNTKPYHDENDGYSGDWFNCPVDFEEVKEKLGVEHEEQIEIADYELPFDLHSDTPLWEINANCRMVLELEGTPIGNEMKAIQQKWFSSFDEFIDHKDEIRYYDVGDGAALAEYLICDSLFSIQVKQPWLLLQYGESDIKTLGSDRVESLLSASPDSLCATDCRLTFCNYHNIYGITLTQRININKTKISI